jgi:bacterioferritin-associated ferredoxin
VECGCCGGDRWIILVDTLSQIDERKLDVVVAVCDQCGLVRQHAAQRLAQALHDPPPID